MKSDPIVESSSLRNLDVTGTLDKVELPGSSTVAIPKSGSRISSAFISGQNHDVHQSTIFKNHHEPAFGSISERQFAAGAIELEMARLYEQYLALTLG